MYCSFHYIDKSEYFCPNNSVKVGNDVIYILISEDMENMPLECLCSFVWTLQVVCFPLNTLYNKYDYLICKVKYQVHLARDRFISGVWSAWKIRKQSKASTDWGEWGLSPVSEWKPCWLWNPFPTPVLPPPIALAPPFLLGYNPLLHSPSHHPQRGVDWVVSHPPLWGRLSLKLRKETKLSLRQFLSPIFPISLCQVGHPTSNILDPPLQSNPPHGG